jgi:hypothetical protein
VTGSLSFSVAVALDDDLVGVVGEAINRTLGEDGIVEERDPLVDGAVAGDDGGGAAVAFEDDLVEIAGLLGVEAAQAEVVDDEDVGGKEATQDLLGRMIGAGLVEALEEVIGAHEANLVTGATGGVSERTSKECLSDSDGSEEDGVLVAFDEAEGEEIADAVAVEGDRSVPVEALEGVLLVEAGLGEADAEILVIAAIDFVLEQKLEQIELAELLFAGIGDAVR